MFFLFFFSVFPRDDFVKKDISINELGFSGMKQLINLCTQLPLMANTQKVHIES